MVDIANVTSSLSSLNPNAVLYGIGRVDDLNGILYVVYHTNPFSGIYYLYGFNLATSMASTTSFYQEVFNIETDGLGQVYAATTTGLTKLYPTQGALCGSFPSGFSPTGISAFDRTNTTYFSLLTNGTAQRIFGIR